MRNVMLVVGIAAVLGCGGISKEQYAAKDAELVKYKQAMQAENDKVAALEGRATSLEQENTTLKGQVGDLQKRLGEFSAAANDLREQAPVRLNARLLFKENSSKITPEGKRALDSMAQAMGASKDKSIIVSGYTDDSEAGGKDAVVKRWQLSSARALEVARYLAGRGLDPSHIAIAGFGQARPVAVNDSLANMALNRRVEIALLPKDMEMRTIDVKPAELTPRNQSTGSTGSRPGE